MTTTTQRLEQLERRIAAIEAELGLPADPDAPIEWSDDLADWPDKPVRINIASGKLAKTPEELVSFYQS